MTYIISDIHGQFRAFKRILEYINFNENDTLYILGDMIDRGPESKKVYLYCKNRDNIVVIKGNHEQMAQEAIETKNHTDISIWYQNGGDMTDNSFRTKEEIDDFYNYISTLKQYAEVEVNNKKYLLIHAGISAPDVNSDFYYTNLKKKNIFDYCEEYNYFLWGRDDKETEKTRNFYFPDYRIIHGHTPQNRKCRWKNNILNIDTGAGSNLTLSCYVIEQEKIISCSIKTHQIEEYDCVEN